MENNIKRYHMINILRLVCAYLVIAIHLVAFGSVGNVAKTFTSDFICRIAVPFFFVTSGYFFYSKVHKEGYFKNYIKKLFIIYIVVTIVYLIGFIYKSMYSLIINKGVIYTIKAFLVNGVSPSLWYFPALIVSVTFVYIFLKRDLIKPLIVGSIILFFIGLMGDSYLGLIKNTPFIHIINGYNFIFDNTRNGITFGVPFITIGVLINKYKLNEKIKKPSRLFILFTVIYGIEVYTLIKNGIPQDYNFYFSLSLVVPIIFIMGLNSKMTINNQTSRYIREMSLWIYAFHELVFMLLCISGFLDKANSVLSYLFVCGIITLIAYIITRIRLKGMVLNKTAARKIVLYSGLLFIIPWALINTPIDNSTTSTKSTAPTVDFSSIENKESTDITGPMWKISDKDSSIYLYGCFTLIADARAGDEKIYPLSSVFGDALNDSDEIILYASTRDESEKDNSNMFFGANGDTLNKHVTEEAFNTVMDKTKESAEKNEKDEEDLNSYSNAWKGGLAYYEICNYLLTNDLNVYNDSNYSTDEYLKYKAKNLNKKVDYMFSANDIFIAVCRNDDNDVNNAYAMLTKYINEDYIKNIKKSFEYWKQGDNDKAAQAFNTFTFENDEDKNNFIKYKEITKEDYDKAFQPFNDKAIDNISTYLGDNRKCFVSLDFKMLSGEDSILTELKGKGYKVEKIGS